MIQLTTSIIGVAIGDPITNKPLLRTRKKAPRRRIGALCANLKTLEALNKSWLTKLSGIEFYILPIGLVASYLLATIDIISLPLGAGLTFLLSLISAASYHICVYYTLKCPQRGKNISKFKNGKNISSKRLHNGFSEGKPCRHCGWEPKHGT